MTQPVTGVFRGSWTTATAYAARDVVTYNGTEYAAVSSHTSGSVFNTALFQAVSATPYTSVSKSAGFTAAPWTVHLVDTTAGAVTATLPPASVAGQQLTVKLDKGSNPVNLAVTGSDTIGSSATSGALTLTSEVWEFTSSGAGQWNLTGGNKSLSSLDGRYAQISASSLVASRSGLTIVAHRGGGGANSGYRGPYPEETLEGFAAAVASGCRWLNPHVRMLADGALVLMHDSTPDRTTNATGAVPVTSYSTAAWKKLKVTPQNTTLWPGYGVDWGEIHPPLLSDYLDRFGGKAAHVFECISGGWQSTGTVSAAVIAMLQARGLAGATILQSFAAGELTAAAAAGIQSMYLPPDLPNAGSDAASIATAMASGWAAGAPKHVGINAFPTGQTQAQVVTYIGTLISAGFSVWAYTATRRYERDWLSTAGAVGVITDEPVYLASNAITNKGAADQLSLAVWPHGLLQADLSKGRGVLTNGGVQLDSTAGGVSTQFVCYGAFSPPASLTSYTVQADFVWDTLDADGTRHMDIMVCCPDDRPTTATIGSGFGLVDGYQVLFRQNASNLTVAKCSQSAQTIANSLVQSTGLPPAPTAGTITTVKVQVTPTQVIVSLIQGGTTYGPFAVTDSTYRGGYFHLGKAYNSTTRLIGTWKNVSCA